MSRLRTRCAPPVFSGFSASDIFTVDQKIRTPYIQNYNFNVQQQLGPGMALQIGYVGSSGHKLFRYRDLNQSIGGGSLPYPDFVYINQFESSAKSNYNGLQLSLRTSGIKTYSRGGRKGCTARAYVTRPCLWNHVAALSQCGRRH